MIKNTLKKIIIFFKTPMWFTVQKISDEWTSSPWVARCFLQIMQIRDLVFLRDSKEKTRFEFLHSKILENLTIANNSRKDIFKLLDEHYDKFQKGIIYSKQWEHYMLNESIDSELKEKFYSFITNLHIAVEDAGKKIWWEFGFKCDIFWEDKAFEKWASTFQSQWDDESKKIVDMLIEDRKWISKLKEIRRWIMHHSWSLWGITYNFDKKILSVPDEIWWIDNFWGNWWQFIEDIIILTLERNLNPPFCIIEIPEHNRDTNNPIKYQVSCLDLINND